MTTTMRPPAPPRFRRADRPAPPVIGGARRPRRSGRGALVAALAILAAVVALLVVRPGDAGDDSTGELTRQRADFLAYAAAFDPLAEDGGRVVQQGLKATVTDLFENGDPAPEVLDRAEGQLGELERIRDRVVALRAPGFLQTTKGLYDHALRDYVATARVLVAASRATGDDRAALVRLAIDMGEETDDLYERAEDAMERARARLGLPPEEGPSS